MAWPVLHELYLAFILAHDPKDLTDYIKVGLLRPGRNVVEEPRVLAAVNNVDLLEEVLASGAEFEKGVPGGGIIGAAGLLLGLGAMRGIEGICLMGETSGYIVDPKSASSLLRVLSGLLKIEVDSANLEERAIEMEQLIERLIEGEKPQSDEELRYIG